MTALIVLTYFYTIVVYNIIDIIKSEQITNNGKWLNNST